MPLTLPAVQTPDPLPMRDFPRSQRARAGRGPSPDGATRGPARGLATPPRRARSLTSRIAPGAGAALVAALAGCGGTVSGNGAALTAAEVDQRVDRLIELTTPLDLDLTSDHHDRQLREQRALVAELKALGDAGLGRAALEALQARMGDEDPVLTRVRLLEVAAYNAPDETEPWMVRWIREYGHRPDVRTESVRVLAETDPTRALEVLEPFVTRERATSTTPDDEFFVRGWVIACRAAGRSPVPELIDVLTNIYKQPIARYYAAQTLGEYEDPIAARALEAVLIESTGDAYLRRKAAQALRDSLPRETACEIFRRTAEYEADIGFLEFLGDMIQDNCE